MTVSEDEKPGTLNLELDLEGQNVIPQSTSPITLGCGMAPQEELPETM